MTDIPERGPIRYFKVPDYKLADIADFGWDQARYEKALKEHKHGNSETCLGCEYDGFELAERYGLEEIQCESGTSESS